MSMLQTTHAHMTKVNHDDAERKKHLREAHKAEDAHKEASSRTYQSKSICEVGPKY
jgi:hypothetical protein